MAEIEGHAGSLIGLSTPRAPFVVRRYVLRSQREASLPPFLGSMVRGALGRSLRHLVCATKMPVCEGCPVRSACAYAALHDGFTPEDVHSGTGEHAPPPLWLRDIEPGRTLAAQETMRFSLVAFGSAARSLPFVDESVRSLARTGLGRDRHPMELVSAEDELRSDLASLLVLRTTTLRDELRARSGRLAVRLVTPVAIRLKGSRWADESRPPPPWPERLAAGAARRRSALERRWLEVPLREVPKVQRAITDASGVTVIDQRIRRERVRRYSFSEGRPMELHGAVGAMTLGGDGLERALPWLVTGELLSVGSSTTFGLGRITLEAV